MKGLISDGTPSDGRSGAALPEQNSFRRMLRHVALWPVVGALLLVVLLLGIIHYLLESARRVEHTHQVLAQIATVEKLAIDMETGLRGFRASTGDPIFLEPYDHALIELPREFNTLEKLVRDNPFQTENLQVLRSAMADWQKYAVDARGRVASKTSMDVSLQLRGKELMDQFRAQAKVMESHEEELLAVRSRNLRRVKGAAYASILFGVGLLGPVLAITIRRTFRRMAGSYAVALAASQREGERVTTILESITDGFFALDPQWRITHRNHWAAKMLAPLHPPKYSQAGQTIWEEFPALSGTEVEAKCRAVLQEKVAADFEFFCLPLQAWLSIRLYPSAEGLSMFFRDITLHKRDEEEALRRASLFREAIENSTDLIYIKDAEGRILAANPATCQTIGKNLQELIGRSGTEWGGDTPETRAIMENDQKVFQTGGRLIFEETFTGRDGVSRIYHSAKACCLDEKGNPVSLIGISRDITGRKRIEEDLRKERQRLSLALGAAEMGVYVWERPDRLWWSPEVYKVFGVPETFEPTFSGFLALVHPDDRAELVRKVGSPFAVGSIFTIEFRIVRPDGQVRWIANRATEEAWAGREITTFGVAMDITDRKRAEEALRQSESFYRQTLESIPGMVFTNTPDGACDYISQQWVEFTGIPAEQQLGDGWLQVLHPDDRERAFAAWRCAVEGRGAYDLEYRVRHRDGHFEWFAVRGRAIRDSGGGIVRWFGTAVNVEGLKRVEAELRKSRERLQAALTGSGSGTFRWEFQTNALDWDENLDHLFGLPASRTVRSLENFITMVHPEDRVELRERCNRSAREGADFEMEFRVLWPDGTVHWLYDKGKTFFGSEGKPDYMAGACVDITKRKQAEAALAKARAELQQHAANLEQTVAERTAKLQAALGELEAYSYSIAHDMRAPLRGMQGFSKLLLEEHAQELKPEARQYLSRIANSAERMDHLIQDVLNYSKIVSGGLPLETLDPLPIFEGILQSYPNLQKGKADISIAGPLPPVLANQAALTQVISNLLGNAVKFVGPGRRPQIRIWAEHIASEPGQTPPRLGRVRFWIEDNGIGIESSAQGRIFQLFQRLHGADRYEGTGLGLAIVRKATERMGGAVGVESIVGKGSRFWFELQKAR